ncbi:sigma factor-like helix-turn-helix DNA-binding protein [Bradyrhizobium genosp. P]|uniref:sigma factor-like helix-turn-helix DNA-binding protein n=1 Tax=Bradyrhizobium genosp. P TaxID=83641 RepID=UPI003CF2B788
MTRERGLHGQSRRKVHVLPRKQFAKWSEEDERKLLELSQRSGLTKREIARELGRSEVSVAHRLVIVRRRLAEEDLERLLGSPE